ncbi:actin-related protein 2/3 complex subunit 1A-like [Tubulanus polymorphus]|uniref:actin-related protein 2/3 complex subunit 1A-like n=1 Tax=Tubulanus polymorphus TaxID=672921 RepID=UPI003DA2F9DC
MSSYSFGAHSISCHAWNKDRTSLALSLNNAEVNIYSQKAGKWEIVHTLKEHTQRVTSIDWGADQNRIVTCGVDRNAYVWTFVDGKWKPTLVILRINRAATCVRWSPKEDKFAVASGARLIAICYFEKEYDWWVSKHIKKPLRSTVTSIDWHPNNVLFAAGSSDFKARVFSGYIKEVEDKPSATPWGKKMTLGSLMCEFSNGGEEDKNDGKPKPKSQGGWVHDVSFSASGNKLAWVGHDSRISVVDSTKDMQMVSVKSKFLPFTTCMWVTENSLVVAGHDCCPMLFVHGDDGKLTFMNKLDVPKQKESSSLSAMQRFRSLDANKGAEDKGAAKTIHLNTITQISMYAGDKAHCSKFTTSAVDGQICIWDFKTLESSIAGLRLV